jgi:uncharacterized membrane protein YecN with MAPEG domain
MLENNIVAIVTGLAFILFIWTAVRVSRARGQYGVAAPATSGHDTFERHFRVQMNTLESLVLFVPSLWLFASYWGQHLAALLGLVWIGGRVVYTLAYVKNPGSRSLGFMISAGAVVLLILGFILGAARMLTVTGGS